MQDSKFNISTLSNSELVMKFGKLVQTERKITHLVLQCIAEIDARKLYLEKAYPSLYEFLVQEFGYSSSAALRRIESARLLREIPEVAAKIESGALNLSHLSKVQQAIRAAHKTEERSLSVEEKRELISRVENSTQKQTEVILSQALSLPIFAEEKKKFNGDESVTLTITFTKDQMAILQKAQDLTSHATSEHKWAETIVHLAQKEVNRRLNIRERGKGIEIAPLKLINHCAETTSRKPLSAKLKKMILQRDQCCQYIDKSTGKMCGSKKYLQFDHRQSIWADGGNELGNLQLLCARHNRHKYSQEIFLKYKSI